MASLGPSASDSRARGNSTSQVAEVEPIRMPTVEEIKGQDIWNNCAVRVSSVVSWVWWSWCTYGVILWSFGQSNNRRDDCKATNSIHGKTDGRRSISNAKTFAVMGLIFSAAECVIEKARAKHGTTNTALAGCVTGGTLAVRGHAHAQGLVQEGEGIRFRGRVTEIYRGPKAKCFGCVGFATFSVAIE
ncbi:hypothetical protein ACP70R_030398 [Stipagrostis hirtigluma subsp. patula]